VRSTGRWPAAAVSALALGLAVTAGCGRATPIQLDASRPADAHETLPDAAGDAQLIEGGQCTTTIESHPDEGAVHIPCVDATDYQTSPPSSGNHYACWAAYQTYAAPIPWGNLVHSLEHGAIVIVYNCPDGCDDDVANIQSFIAGLPLDANCGPTLGKDRMILMPDPTLVGVRFAASAWTWTLRADCFDPAAFRQFFDDHYDHGREIICSDGWQPDQLCSDVCS
jgi:hypothetical protein